MQQVYCPQCGALVEAANINLDNMMAKCGQCHTVFSIADLQKESLWSRRDEPIDLPVEMPRSITVDDDGMRLRIVRRWFGVGTVIILIFTVIWDAIIFGVFVPNLLREDFDEIPLLFMVPFILVGLFLAYTSIAGLLNRTTITVDMDQLRVQHGPIPFPGKRLNPGDLQQLYTKQVVTQTKNGTSTSYELRATTHEGKDQKLIGGLDRSDQAMFMEQEIERFLRIKDRPVRGEYL